MHENSIQAYATVDISTAQRAVFDFIRGQGAATDKEIAAGLGWTINRVTPRRGELVKIGLVEQKGNGIADSGRKQAIWGVKSNG